MEPTASVSQLPPPPPPPDPQQPPAPPRPPQRNRQRPPARPPRFSGPQWLAGIGTFLLTTAAVTLVGARWDRFDPGERLTILLVCSVLAYGLTLVLRKIAPFTSRSLDVLVAALIPVDIAAMAVVSGASWPAVLLAAGPAAILSSEILRRRDPMVFTEAGTIVGGVLTACGIAAEITMSQFDLPVAPLVAVMGLAATATLPFGKTRLFGPVWAALAGFAPVIRLLESVSFTGQGTLSDMGLLHNPTDAAATFTIVAGAVAAVALGLAAVRRDAMLAGLAAFGVVVTTAVDLWVRFDPPSSAVLIALAASFCLVELALAHRGLDLRKDIRDTAGNVVAAVNGILTFVAVTAAFGDYLPDGEVASGDWKYTAAICGVAWLLGDLRRGLNLGQSTATIALVGGNWGPALAGFVAAIIASTQLTFEDPTLTGLVAIGLALAAVSTLRPGRLLTSWTLAFIAPILAVGDWEVAAAISVASAALMLLVGRYATGAGESELGFQAGLFSIVPALVGAVLVGVANDSVVLASGFVIVTVWLTAWIANHHHAGLSFGLRVLGSTAIGVLVAEGFGTVALAAALVAGASLVEFVRLGDSRYRLFGAAAGLLAIGFVLPFPNPANPFFFGASLMVGLIAIGLVAQGRYANNEGLAVFGLLVAGLSWMLGMISAGVASPEPYVYPVLFFVSWLFHDADDHPWMVVGPSLAAATALGFWQRIETGDSGHLIALGVVALLTTVWGGFRRQSAALSFGSAVTVAVATYEGLDSTVGIEAWGWLVIAGSAALTVAAILESDSGKGQTESANSVVTGGAE